MPSPVSPADSEAPEKYYPSLHIDGDAKDLDQLPDSGEMTVKFKKTSHTTRTANGKSTATVGLDILSIEDVESGEDEASEEEEPGDALDKAKAEVEAEGEEK